MSESKLNDMKAEEQRFVNTVWNHYNEHQRRLPWREPEADGSFDPYKILASEVMLQQTQVPRVIPKYQEFLEAFPTIRDLANAPLSDVLKVWQGLGYNRRAKYLHETAKLVVKKHNGLFPQTRDELVKLPGIGPNTAGAILAYAHNRPELFVETNIRSVYLHHFFSGRDKVTDNEILKVVAETIPEQGVREWYWALMDYGVYLKKTHGNPNARSKHYVRQSRFQGSKRQVRGEILRQLGRHPQTLKQLKDSMSDIRLEEVLNTLQAEALIHYDNGRYYLGQP